MTEQLAIDRVTVLRRAWRHDDAERLIEEELSGAAAEVELGRIAVQRGRYAPSTAPRKPAATGYLSLRIPPSRTLK
ncbi:hypothetical protein [Amycolatopsis sp. NPDC051071]|uniref:hypothetical protein n=1 Tax=Amycolatopsis sp. NPDC051071 TaxID=3154637 RepID=UPI00343D8503